MNLIPLARDLISHNHVTQPKSAGRPSQHIVQFNYPDGVRTFDGTQWTCVPNDPADKVTNIKLPSLG